MRNRQGQALSDNMGAKYMRVDDANDLALRRSQRFNSRVGPSTLSKKYLYKKPALGICSRLYSRTRTSVDNETNTSDNSCMRYQIFGRKLYYCGLIMFEKQYLRRQFHIFGYIYMVIGYLNLCLNYTLHQRRRLYRYNRWY